MIVFPCAKINLGLYVERLRPDGYRDIRTVMLPVPLFDVLEVVEAPDLGPGKMAMTYSGIPVPGDPANDLCLRAARAFAAVHPLPGIRIHLHKRIPTGAGLGGGSSDAAHMILLLNDLSDGRLGPIELAAMAAGLGSDCPFFLKRTTQLAEGRGERLSPVKVQLDGWWLALVNPGIHVGTAEVYARTPVREESVDLPALMRLGPDAWTDRLHNRMEAHVLQQHPEVARVKSELAEAGAVYVAMSGSGSTVFGLFKQRPELLHLTHKPLLVVQL